MIDNTKIKFRSLFNDGLYYIWSKSAQRPCVMRVRAGMPEAILAFRSHAEAEQYVKAMGQPLRRFPVRHVPLSESLGELRSWLAQWQGISPHLTWPTPKDSGHEFCTVAVTDVLRALGGDAGLEVPFQPNHSESPELTPAITKPDAFTERRVTGEIFELGGRVACTVPGLGQEGAIPFAILGDYIATNAFPGWTDVVVGPEQAQVVCRVATEMAQAPFMRLADCLAFVHVNYRFLSGLTSHAVVRTFPPAPHPNAQEFIFWPAQIAGRTLVMIDLKSRYDQWNNKPNSPGLLHDGQHRRFSLN